MLYHVYQVVNFKTGQYYIGYTKNPKLRSSNHFSPVQKNTVCNFKRNEAFFEILQSFQNKKDAVLLESLLIEEFVGDIKCLNIFCKEYNSKNALYMNESRKFDPEYHSNQTSKGAKLHWETLTKNEKIIKTRGLREHAKKVSKSITMTDLQGNIIKTYESGLSILKDFPELNKHSIYRVANKTQKQHKGYKFFYNKNN